MTRFSQFRPRRARLRMLSPHHPRPIKAQMMGDGNQLIKRPWGCCDVKMDQMASWLLDCLLGLLCPRRLRR